MVNWFKDCCPICFGIFLCGREEIGGKKNQTFLALQMADTKYF